MTISFAFLFIVAAQTPAPSAIDPNQFNALREIALAANCSTDCPLVPGQCPY
jgi:hypothetical protein